MLKSAMSSSTPPSPGAPSPETLVSLLTDPSKTTRRAILAALEGLGPLAWPPLAEAAAGQDAALRARARKAQMELARRGGERLLRAALATEPSQNTLLEGLLAIDQILGFRLPDGGTRELETGSVLASLDDWAGEFAAIPAWREGPPIAAAGALRRVLGEGAGLGEVTSDFHNLQNVSLTRTVERRCGLPLTLSAIYAIVARRSGLEAELLPFPGHVLLAVGGDDPRRVIVDPFQGGVLVSEDTCRARLAAMGAPPSPDWLRPASDRAMLVRQTRNLSAAMLRHGRDREAELFARLSAEFG